MTQLSTARRATALIALCLTQLVIYSSMQMTTFALPAIAKSLDSSVQTLQWVTNVYIVVYGCFLLASATLADRIGRRNIYVTGAVLFALASVVAATATSEWQLLLGRGIQGLAGSMMSPVAVGMIAVIFPQKAERARALALWSAVAGMALAIGPLAGGLLTDAFGWQSVFWICVPLLAIGAIACAMTVPANRSAHKHSFDGVGQLLMAIALASLVFSIVEVSSLGWGSPVVIIGFAIAIVSTVALVLYELRHPDPAIPVRLLSDRGVRTALASAALGIGAFYGLLFVLSLYLQSVRGLTATQAGLVTVATGVLAIVAAFVAGKFVARDHASLALFLAGVIIVVSAIGMFFAEHAPIWVVMIPTAAFGFGYGLVSVPSNSVAVSALPSDESARAASLMSVSRQIGRATGIAVVASIIGTVATGTGEHAVDGFFHVSKVIWIFLAACGAVMVLINVVPQRGRKARKDAAPHADPSAPAAGPASPAAKG